MDNLHTISTEHIIQAISDANKLDSLLTDIYNQYGGWNIRAFCYIAHSLNTQIEVNGELLYEGGKWYADIPEFHWNGNPDKITSIRLLEYHSLWYIYVKTFPDEENSLIRTFDVDGDDFAEVEKIESVSYHMLDNELALRKEFIETAVVAKAREIFTELIKFVSSNNMTICYDEDNAAVFLGPNDLKWNHGLKHSNMGRTNPTHTLMKYYANKGHIATDCITHLHISDSDETFRNCDLTYIP